MRKFLIVDDHSMFCEALKLSLENYFAEATFDIATRLSEAKERLLQEQHYSLILLDVNIPDAVGLQGLVSLREKVDTTPIILISAADDPEVITEAMARGAHGFVSKNESTSKICSAIETVLRGEYHLPDGFDMQKMRTSIRQKKSTLDRVISLTEQQLNIVSLVEQGLSNKEIARKLSIQEATVKVHMTTILRKLGVTSRTQIVLAMQKARSQERLFGKGADIFGQAQSNLG